MVSYKELMAIAALAGVNAQAGEWNSGGNNMDTSYSTASSNQEAYTDVTLHVHSHTPI